MQCCPEFTQTFTKVCESWWWLSRFYLFLISSMVIKGLNDFNSFHHPPFLLNAYLLIVFAFTSVPCCSMRHVLAYILADLKRIFRQVNSLFTFVLVKVCESALAISALFHFKILDSESTKQNVLKRMYWILSNRGCSVTNWRLLEPGVSTLQNVGCDFQIDSNAVEDRCGICQGNGSTCKTVKKTFEKSEGLGRRACIFNKKRH